MSSPLEAPIQDWPFPPIQDTILSHHTPIRRFCAERLDQEPSDLWPDCSFLDIEAWSSSFDSSSPDESTTFIDVDDFINTTDADFDDPVTPTPPLAPDTSTRDIESAGSISQGLELVHLLLACAEAVGCRDTALAASTLSQIWPLANPSGDSLQRVSFCFAAGLKSRLSLLQNLGSSGSLATATNNNAATPAVTREERIEAFHLLYQTTPYVAFGFMAANEAICQAAQGKPRIHIVDLGMEHALQWPSLVRTLASRPGGPPAVRITGVGFGLAELYSAMKPVVADASSLGVALEFKAIAEPERFTAETLGLKEGETLFVNSIMQLHKYVKESRGSLKAVLVSIKKLNPALVTVVEQDANHNGPFFLARFLESLHYYSAVFDSLEASLPRPSEQRRKIEGWQLGEEIRNVVACEGAERVERHERADQWRRQLGRAGFHVAAGVGAAASQARMLVGVYGCEGYTVAAEKGCLVLGWKGRPVVWASAWQVAQPAAASS